MLGEPDEAIATGTHALELIGQSGDLRLRIPAISHLAMAHYMRGDFLRTIKLSSENLAALPTDWTYEYFGMTVPPSIFDRTWLAMSLAQVGRFKEAAKYEAEAIELAERTHHFYTLSLTYRHSAASHMLKGDWPIALNFIERTIAVDRTGNVTLMAINFAYCVRILVQLGALGEALNRLREAEDLHALLLGTDDSDRIGLQPRLPVPYYELGQASLLLGRIGEAQLLAARAMEFSLRNPGPAAHTQRLLGDIASHPDRFNANKAEVHYNKALALAEPRDMHPLIAHCHLGLGKLHGITGQQDRALEHLILATRMYREMDMSFWLAQADAVMGKLRER
jgi:tetratricopeptide (TPR) repeat protein